MPDITTYNRAEADVANELGAAGVAFADLVSVTGKSVADAQLELNKTAAATISAMAKAQVEVIAAQETIYDDFGNVSGGNVHTRKLPLINFIEPPVYEWTHVRVQGNFRATEVTTESHASDDTTTSSNKLSGGFVLFAGGLQGSNRSTTTLTERDQASAEDVSVGQMRLNARLQPRRDTVIPRPRQVVKGPQMYMLEGPIEDFKEDPANEARLTARSLELTVRYTRPGGAPIPNKVIGIETNGLAWSYKDGVNKTDSNGELGVVLRRYFDSPDASTAPASYVVSGRIGLVANDTTVNF